MDATSTLSRDVSRLRRADIGTSEALSERWHHLLITELPPVREASLEGQLTNLGEQVLLRGTLMAGVQLECSRCLEEFEQPLKVRVDGGFTQQPTPGHLTKETPFLN